MKQPRLLRTLLAMLLGIGLSLGQVTWALAGTTGSLSGTVTDDKGAPVADASVTAIAPSGTSSAKTDGAGRFAFVSLTPDTYTVSVAKSGYTPATLGGVTIFADQAQVLSLHLQAGLTVIANTTSRASGNLVKPGTTSDVYSVNAATQNILSSGSGGYNLNSAYSAIYAQPGVTSFVGNKGAGQVFYIRGGSYSQTGYEYDGVPVNRAFDNYNANSLSSLGQQELQVYTGGSPAGASSATLGGFINQVIKAGTYPGFGTADLALGDPTFYHNLKLEAGGASPDRLFSWYAGVQADNADYRLWNNQDGGSVSSDPTNQYGFFANPSYLLSPQPFYGNAAVPVCQNGGIIPAGAAGCWASGPNSNGLLTSQDDRETVLNFHFGIPHRNDGGRDDVQLLYNVSLNRDLYNDSINDNGGLAQYDKLYAEFGGLCGFMPLIGKGCATSGGSPFPYQDGLIWPTGTQFGQSATGLHPSIYYFPNSPQNRAAGPGLDSSGNAVAAGIPLGIRSGIDNNAGIVKLQYQKNFGSTAYARLFAYSFYSDWLQTNPNSASQGLGTGGTDYLATYFSRPTYNYELSTHTRGIEFQFANQINAQNLVKFTANYTTATANRFNNSSFRSTAGTLVTSYADAAGNCYNYTTGALSNCLVHGGSTMGSYANPTPGLAPAGSAAALAGASWLVTVPGGNGTLNRVRPVFTSVALEDEFRPNDKLDLDLGVRFESYQYNLSDTSSPAYTFWFNQAAHAYCYNTTTLQPVVGSLGPTGVPPAPPIVADVCPAGSAHPDGLSGHELFTAVEPSNYTHGLFSPRLSGTYSLDPNTVIRFSAGRYSQPTAVAFEQYINESPKSAASFNYTNFFGYGFTTLGHDNPVQVSNNYDLSLEKHLNGTDVTFKLTPYYRYTTNQNVSILLGPSFAGGVNIGTQKSTGIEFAIQKGDPNRDGWAGSLSYSYTKARIKYNNLANGTNAIDVLNNYIGDYNALTQAGGGAKCYTPSGASAGTPDPTCAATSIANPYYSAAPQGKLDRNGWYETYVNNPPGDAPDNSVASAISPNFFTGFVQYKRGRLAIAPNFTLAQGTAYGSPTAIYGIDPRSCTANEGPGGSHIVGAGSPYAQNADYNTCGFSTFTQSGNLAIPDPYTGSFDGVGQYRSPWQLNINAQVRYDVSAKVTATLTVANIYNRCFGGSKTPWSSAFPPNNFVCGYASNAGFFNGTQPGAGFFYGGSQDDPLNGGGVPAMMKYPYGSVAGALPIQAYLNFQIKL